MCETRGVTSYQEPSCFHSNKPADTPLKELPLALWFWGDCSYESWLIYLMKKKQKTSVHSPIYYPVYTLWHITSWLFIWQSVFLPPPSFMRIWIAPLSSWVHPAHGSHYGKRSFHVWCGALALIRSCVLMCSDNPEGEHRPGFMMPLGTTSTKMVLRGETLELECIAEGL